MRILLRLVALLLVIGAGLGTIPGAEGPTEGAAFAGCPEDTDDNDGTPTGRARGGWPRRRPFLAHRVGVGASGVTALVRPDGHSEGTIQGMPKYGNIAPPIC